MSSSYITGTVELGPYKNCSYDEGERNDYPFPLPRVFLKGELEEYYPQISFSWSDDTVLVTREDKIMAYTTSSYSELLAEDEDGTKVWLDGRNAPFSDCWKGKYLGDVREAQEYKIVEYNLKTLEKKTYKVQLNQTEQIQDYELKQINDLTNMNTPADPFNICDGALVSYDGQGEDVIVPDGVKSINGDAFGFRKYKSITFPNTVGNIPVNVLLDCEIEQIIIAEDNPYYSSRDGLLIDKRTKTLVRAFAGTEIPDDGTVVKIGHYAFSNRSVLKQIVIPDCIDEIGMSAFENCVNLESALISNSVNVLASRAFSGCVNLKTAILPLHLRKIGDHAFSYCRSLREITIPETVTEIGVAAFEQCLSLEAVVLPQGMKCIDTLTFFCCEKLKTVKLPSSIIEIRNGAFGKCESIEGITLPDNLVEIGSGAFERCRALTNITLPDGIVYLGDDIFANCKGLMYVQLPNSIHLIPKRAFMHCEKLTTINIPDSVRKIGENAFLGCESIQGTDDHPFVIPHSVKLIGDNAFARCYSINRVVLPEDFMDYSFNIFREKIAVEGETVVILHEGEKNDVFRF